MQTGPDDLFTPSEEHRMLRKMVADFTRDEVEPQAEEQDRIGALNVPLFRRLGDLGLLGLTVPEPWGGAGMDATAAVIVCHEMSKSDPGFTLAYLAHAMLFVNNFFRCADDAQRERYLPKVLTGEWIAGLGMTEPGAGTDVLAMTTHAHRTDRGYVLNGRKIFITNGVEGSVFFVYAKVDGRITSFVVDVDCPGFSRGQVIHKMGMRGSSMAELVFDDCEVPRENLIGEEGGGLVHMMRNLELERLTLAAQSLGIADRCVDVMIRYADERRAFGRPLNHLGQIQRYIGEAYAKTEALRCLVYQVARTLGPDRRNRIGSDAAKLFAATTAKEVADAAIQVLGGYGYCVEYKVERLFRDAKLIEIGGGTLESHQKNLTKDLTRGLRG
ncbi:MAG: acyl-CoA dehydrogenase family protein [Deltaproteobacteria bacterium]|nr:acyl-CoA dehydrogenase family protein [Deltaproteobacteria bacterium]